MIALAKNALLSTQGNVKSGEVTSSTHLLLCG